MMTPEIIKKLIGYQRTVFRCEKCGAQVCVETDYTTSVVMLEKLHSCKGKAKK